MNSHYWRVERLKSRQITLQAQLMVQVKERQPNMPNELELLNGEALRIEADVVVAARGDSVLQYANEQNQRN